MKSNHIFLCEFISSLSGFFIILKWWFLEFSVISFDLLINAPMYELIFYNCSHFIVVTTLHIELVDLIWINIKLVYQFVVEGNFWKICDINGLIISIIWIF